MIKRCPFCDDIYSNRYEEIIRHLKVSNDKRHNYLYIFVELFKNNDIYLSIVNKLASKIKEKKEFTETEQEFIKYIAYFFMISLPFPGEKVCPYCHIPIKEDEYTEHCKKCRFDEKGILKLPSFEFGPEKYWGEAYNKKEYQTEVENEQKEFCSQPIFHKDKDLQKLIRNMIKDRECNLIC